MKTLYSPFDPRVQLTSTLCVGQTWVKCVFAAAFEFPIVIAWEPFSETNIFVCASGKPDIIKVLKIWASIQHHSP